MGRAPRPRGFHKLLGNFLATFSFMSNFCFILNGNFCNFEQLFMNLARF